MSATPPVNMIEFVPNAASQPHGLHAAPAQSVARFEQLLYQPGGGHVGSTAVPATNSDFLSYLEQMSSRWRAGQDSIEQLSRKGTLTMDELLKVQTELVNSTVNVEISSKATGILENSVQSLVQRGQ